MYKNERTLRREGHLEGIGIHTGEKVKVSFEPAPEGTGIVFSQASTPTAADKNFSTNGSLRSTTVSAAGVRIRTVEHLMAALFGLGICNLKIHIQGSEMPGLDGSALDFILFFKQIGVVDQTRPREFYKIKEPIFCHNKTAAIAIYPADEFSVAYTLDYPHPLLKNHVDFTLSPEVFENEIAPARTFCTEEESRFLRSEGLGLGATHENTLVVSEKGVVGNRLRFPDECARHKVLDILGDVSLLGFGLVGRIVGLRSGHALNQKLIEAIKKERQTTMTSKKNTKGCALNLDQIMEILPHRYPFLMVDRITELDDRHAVGIKNITINEAYFQGHFPGKPVMPGVLIIEALAQVGGLISLSKHRGKIAYLVSINDARFRKMVVPGDQLVLEVGLLKTKARIGLVKGVAKVDGQEVCSAELMFSLGPE
ncbi:MAG: UDP-3-O-[3-hydroxymyristoyl] N-acetylglucosamine deacetylase [Candidatus Omnitrophica bacterium]|nr:UDP-3-O-[3-hydroxymyristoyl] N-acetylglucosamine deacetylase [Candidatus Omnitrophota bacterium]